MPKRALIEHRPWLMASVIAALAYYFLQDNPIGEVWLMLIKGSAVGFLAIYALRRAPGADGKLLAVVMAICAVADAAIQLSLFAGGALFAIAHLVAMGLYIRNRRQTTSISQKLLAAALIIGAPAVSYLLTDRQDVFQYSIILGLMASFAWISRFPRYRVGLGAVLFVVSDWLIFSRDTPSEMLFSFASTTFSVPDLLIWPLYFAGQLMIATGVTQTLRGETPAR